MSGGPIGCLCPSSSLFPGQAWTSGAPKCISCADSWEGSSWGLALGLRIPCEGLTVAFPLSPGPSSLCRFCGVFEPYFLPGAPKNSGKAPHRPW